MRQLELIEIGSRVKIGEHRSRIATITAINIKEGLIQYEVYWWEGSSRTEMWISEKEMDKSGASTFVAKLNLQ